MSNTQKKDWTELEDEEDRMEPHYDNVRVTRPVEKQMPDGTIQKVDQTFIIKNWVFPVRKQVKERKNMQKFGEVKNIPKGEHKPGDYQVEQVIRIETSDEQGELAIVNQLSKMTTESMMIRKQELKLEEIDKEPTKKEEKKGDKWGSLFKDTPKTNYSLKVSSIISYESKLDGISLFKFL